MLNPFKNWKLKFLAVISAIILLLFVVGVENNVLTLPDAINPQIRNLASNLLVKNNIPSIRIKLKSKKTRIKDIVQDIEVYLDLRNAVAGTNSVKVNAISNVDGTEIVDYEPKEVELTIDKIISKSVDLKLIGSRKIADGFILKNSIINPSKVTISGNENELEKIKVLNVNYPLQGNETSSFSKKINISEFLSEAERKLNIAPTEIELSFEITPVENEKPIPQEEKLQKAVSEAKLILPDQFRSNVESVKISLVGREKDLNELKKTPLTVKVNLKGDVLWEEMAIPANLEIAVIGAEPNKINLETVTNSQSLNFLQFGQ